MQVNSWTLQSNPICSCSKPSNSVTHPAQQTGIILQLHIHTSTLAVQQRQCACTEAVVPQRLLRTMACHTVRLSNMNTQYGATAHWSIAACMLRHHACNSRQHHAHASRRRPVRKMGAHASIADRRCTGSLITRRSTAVRCAAGADEPADSAPVCTTASAQHSSLLLCM